MNSPLQLIYTSLAISFGLALAWLLWRKVQIGKAAASNRAQTLFSEVLPLLETPTLKIGEAVGTWLLEGRYNNRHVQFKAIVDNLAPRKLPGLWLMVTRAQPQPVPHIFDLMMRPAGPMSFSNFDFLPHSLPTPPGFPNLAVLHADQPSLAVSPSVITRHLSLFNTPIGKEMLISPKGLRLVVLLAQADRARYGVMRQADFGDTAVSTTLAKTVLDELLALEDDIATEFGNKHE